MCKNREETQYFFFDIASLNQKFVENLSIIHFYT